MPSRPPVTGALDNRVTIQRDVGTARTTSGQHVEDWQDYVAVWAALSPVSGDESQPAAQTQATVRHEAWIRFGSHTSGLTAAMRLNFGGRLIYLTSVVRFNERGFWWFCEGVERT